MIRHAWSVLCSHVVTDKESNNVTLNVLEQVTFKYSSKKLPPGQMITIPFPGSVVSLWYKDKKNSTENITARVRIRNSKGKFLGEGRGPVKFEGNLRARTTSKFNEIPAPQEGHEIYFFVVEYRSGKTWRKAAEIPIELEVTRLPLK